MHNSGLKKCFVTLKIEQKNFKKIKFGEESFEPITTSTSRCIAQICVGHRLERLQVLQGTLNDACVVGFLPTFARHI